MTNQQLFISVSPGEIEILGEALTHYAREHLRDESPFALHNLAERLGTADKATTQRAIAEKVHGIIKKRSLVFHDMDEDKAPRWIKMIAHWLGIYTWDDGVSIDDMATSYLSFCCLPTDDALTEGDAIYLIEHPDEDAGDDQCADGE